MLQKKAKKAEASKAAKVSGASAAREAAKKGMAAIKALDQNSLRALRNKVLTNAIKLLENGWISGALATDKLGFYRMPTNKSAVNFCAIGALKAQEAEFGRDVIQEAVYAVNQSIPTRLKNIGPSQYGYSGAGKIVEFNDGASIPWFVSAEQAAGIKSRKKKAVIAAFKRAKRKGIFKGKSK